MADVNVNDLISLHRDFSENLIPDEGEASEGSYTELTMKGSNPIYRVGFEGKDYFALNLPFVPKNWVGGATQIDIDGSGLVISEVTLESFEGVGENNVIKIVDDRLVSTIYLNKIHWSSDVKVSCYSMSSTLYAKEFDTLITGSQKIREDHTALVNNVGAGFDPVNTVASKILNLENSLGSTSTEVSDIETNVGNISAKVDTNTSNISTNKTEIDSITTRVDGIDTSIINLETTTNSNSSEIDVINEELSKIKSITVVEKDYTKTIVGTGEIPQQETIDAGVAVDLTWYQIKAKDEMLYVEGSFGSHTLPTVTVNVTGTIFSTFSLTYKDVIPVGESVVLTLKICKIIL